MHETHKGKVGIVSKVEVATRDVHADEVTNVDLLFPTIAFESVPLLEINFCQFVAHPFFVLFQ